MKKAFHQPEEAELRYSQPLRNSQELKNCFQLQIDLATLEAQP